MNKFDCSFIKHVRVSHEQFVSIEKKAKYLLIEDRDKGGCISFERVEKSYDEDKLSEKIDDIHKKTTEKIKDNLIQDTKSEYIM